MFPCYKYIMPYGTPYVKHILNLGEDFEVFPETSVIFITENDVWGKGYPLYHIERYIMETGENLGMKHIFYM